MTTSLDLAAMATLLALPALAQAPAAAPSGTGRQEPSAAMRLPVLQGHFRQVEALKGGPP